MISNINPDRSKLYLLIALIMTVMLTQACGDDKKKSINKVDGFKAESFFDKSYNKDPANYLGVETYKKKTNELLAADLNSKVVSGLLKNIKQRISIAAASQPQIILDTKTNKLSVGRLGEELFFYPIDQNEIGVSLDIASFRNKGGSFKVLHSDYLNHFYAAISVGTDHSPNFYIQHKDILSSNQKIFDYTKLIKRSDNLNINYGITTKRKIDQNSDHNIISVLYIGDILAVNFASAKTEILSGENRTWLTFNHSKTDDKFLKISANVTIKLKENDEFKEFSRSFDYVKPNDFSVLRINTFDQPLAADMINHSYTFNYSLIAQGKSFDNEQSFALLSYIGTFNIEEKNDEAGRYAGVFSGIVSTSTGEKRSLQILADELSQKCLGYYIGIVKSGRIC